MTKEEMRNAIRQFGTPFYGIDLDAMRQKIIDVKSILPDNVKLCFAMKANPCVVRHMASLVDKIEICSYGEYQICKESGIPPGQMTISGVLKKEQELQDILDTFGGRPVYTIESLEQYRILAAWSTREKNGLSVLLRLTSGNQFGMDKETIEKIIERRYEYPFLNIAGIHFYSGTQKKNKQDIFRELAEIDSYVKEWHDKYQYKMENLEYGPGIKVTYFQVDKGQEDRISRADILAIQDMIRDRYTLTIEIGRALVADAGYYFTSVCDLKRNNHTNYCIVDGGLHQMNYDGQIRGMYHPPIEVLPTGMRENTNDGAGDDESQIFRICGSLCTVNDIICNKIQLPKLQIGDVIVFKKAGAYSMTEGMALFLSHEIPAVYLYGEQHGWSIARERQETYKINIRMEK